MRDPRRAIMEDLIIEIRCWINQGKYIILAINLNSHVIKSDEVAILREAELYEAIIDRHYEKRLYLTYQRG